MKALDKDYTESTTTLPVDVNLDEETTEEETDSGGESSEETETVEPESWSILSIQYIKDQYLFGIDLSDQEGNPLPDSLFAHYIDSAVDWLQNLLDIQISELEVSGEQHDYNRSDYQNWGYLQTFHNPVKEVKAVKMMYGNRPSVDIPLDWIKLDKLTGQLHIFPSEGSAGSLIIGNTGLLYGFHGAWQFAPQLWSVDYVAGVDENDKTFPTALLQEAIYKRAACGILNVWGDLILGAGIASQSVSIDGVSQSIGTTQSAMFGGASARIESYTKDINEQILPSLKMKFSGIRMVVV